VLKDLGRLDEAVAAYVTAIRIQPDFAEAHSNLGAALRRLGRFDDAINAYDNAIRLKPDYAQAHFNLGNALFDLGLLDGASAAYKTAIRLNPKDAGARTNLGKALSGLGLLDEAIAAHRSAIRVRPGYAEAHSNLGATLQDSGRSNDAIAAYDSAICLKPNFAEAHSNRGNALRDLGRLDDAIAAYTSAIHLKPDCAEAYSNLGNALSDLGRLDNAIAAYNSAICIDPDYSDAHSNLLMSLHYREGIAGDAILTEARRYAERLEKGLPTPSFANVADPGRRLRIGYVLGDFCRHPVGHFLSSVLACHDRVATEVFCYSNSARADGVTTQLRGAADHWRRLVGVSDQTAVAMVAADGIDILVDLSGHTALNRLPMFARRPAPVQVTWLGFWGTTGLSTMDYILSDAATIPPGEDVGYSEQVLRLPDSRFCYAPPNYAPPPASPPFLRGSAVTFGSFNNMAKVGPAVVQLWARVLQAVPESRLLLKWKSLDDGGMRRRLTQDFAAAGVGPERLMLRGASPHEAMLAEYGDMDIALDPFPFSGGLTSCEALWMGVPVVTLPGIGAPSRQTLGFLQVLGLSEWAAASPADYVRIAAALAADRERLGDLRQSLRPRMAVSPLCDGLAFTRNLEAAYRDMWRRWCRKRLGPERDRDQNEIGTGIDAFQRRQRNAPDVAAADVQSAPDGGRKS
jgi:predicted O-linked N-acetylglucosamine transferase (SPINDLY family)